MRRRSWARGEEDKNYVYLDSPDCVYKSRPGLQYRDNNILISFKYRIWETLNLLACVKSSINIILKKTLKVFFFFTLVSTYTQTYKKHIYGH